MGGRIGGKWVSYPPPGGFCWNIAGIGSERSLIEGSSGVRGVYIEFVPIEDPDDVTVPLLESEVTKGGGV